MCKVPAKFAIQTEFRNFFGEQHMRQTNQLVGLFLELEFAKLDFGLKSKPYSGVFLVPIAAFI